MEETQGKGDNWEIVAVFCRAGQTSAQFGLWCIAASKMAWLGKSKV